LWAVITLSSLIVLGILILCVPLYTALRINVYGRPEFRIRFIWLFGLVAKEIGGRKKKPEEKERAADRRRKRAKRGTEAGVIFKILRTKGLVRQLKRLAKGIFRHLKVTDLRVDFRVGVDNPADTALMFGPISVASLLWGDCPPYEISVRPSFTEAVFEGYLWGAARLRPIQTLAPLIRFALSPATIRAAKILVLSKWKRKK
jgi:hypothetical protein